MSSEADRGISEQPPSTCPLIDSAIESCDRAGNYAEEMTHSEDEETRKAYFRDIDGELDNAEAQMEDARRNAADIREWGQEWKDRAQELEDQLHAIKSDIAELIGHKETMSSYLDDIYQNLEDI